MSSEDGSGLDGGDKLSSASFLVVYITAVNQGEFSSSPA